MKSLRSRVLLALAAFALILSASCGGSGGSTGPIVGGGNTPPAPFNLTFPQTGTSHTLTFPNAATFGYHCTPHRSQGMTGTVMVNSGGTDSAQVNVGQGGNNFNPASVTIKPGGTVRWVNVSAMTNHTVTSD
jgi:plastocyanin